MAEKRRSKRKISRNQIKFGQEVCDKTAFTSNLSETGFFVRTTRAFPPGTILNFEFQLPGNEIVKVKGRVVHSSRVPSQISRVRRGGMGVQIIGDPGRYTELLVSGASREGGEEEEE